MEHSKTHNFWQHMRAPLRLVKFLTRMDELDCVRRQCESKVNLHPCSKLPVLSSFRQPPARTSSLLTCCCRPTWWIRPDWVSQSLSLAKDVSCSLSTVSKMWTKCGWHGKVVKGANLQEDQARHQSVKTEKLTAMCLKNRASSSACRLPSARPQEMRRLRPRPPEPHPHLGGDSGAAGRRATGSGSAPSWRVCGASEVSVRQSPLALLVPAAYWLMYFVQLCVGSIFFTLWKHGRGISKEL